MPFAATWIDLDLTIPSEVSQTERNKYYTISLICETNKDTNELISKTECYFLLGSDIFGIGII